MGLTYDNPYAERVQRACLDACPGILQRWLPRGHIIGHEYRCGNLTGGTGTSLKVTLAGEWEGFWKDHNGGPKDKGDLINLYARVKSISYNDALKELADQFGIKPEKRERRSTADLEPSFPVPESAYTVDANLNPILPIYTKTKPTAYWAYWNTEGQLLNFRVRFDSKTKKKSGKPDKDVLPLSYCKDKKTGEYRWDWKDLPRPHPLYGLLGLACAPSKVLVVEGEKKVEHAQKLLPDWTVISWPSGAKNVEYADWSPLVKTTCPVLLWPDRDKDGEEAMEKVARILGIERCSVIIPDPKWPEHHDVADLDWDSEKLRTWLASNTKKVELPVHAARVAVALIGTDPLHHLEAIYDAVKKIDAPLFATEYGPCEVQPNLYGRLTVQHLDGKAFRDWVVKHLDTRKYAYNELRSTLLDDRIASAAVYHARHYLPPLLWISHVPMLMPSSEVLETPGYNSTTKTYLSLPKDYSSCPSQKDATELLNDFLVDFPFETNADRTHAVAYALTGLTRYAIEGNVPLFRFEAPRGGTGKSLLCQILSELITPSFDFLPSPETGEEMEKLIGSEAIKFPGVIAFDNVEKFACNTVERALTYPFFTFRRLGVNQMVTVKLWSIWAITLNNPHFKPTMLRRSVRVRVNAKMDHPEERPSSMWKHEQIIEYGRKNRSFLLAALACLAKLDGSANGNLPTLGSFERWGKIVGSKLAAAGYQDFLGTYKTDIEQATEQGEDETGTFVQMWYERHGTDEVANSELLEIARIIDGLPVQRSKDGSISGKSFGMFLSKLRGQTYGGIMVSDRIKREWGHAYKLMKTNELHD